MSSNSSTGQILGYVVGAVVGYFTGGTGWALVGNMMSSAAAGGAVGGMLDPPKGPTLVGPRLGDLSVQSATYGAHIPRIYGTVATMGNVFWLEGDKLKETLTKKKSGGKGGGGGSTVKTYSYSATFAVGLCKGPIVGIRRVWVGAKLVYDAGSNDIESIIASNQAEEKFRLYLGTEDQMPDPRMQADKGAANVPAYRGLAYLVIYDYQLADHGNSLIGAQVKVEVIASGSISEWSRKVTVEDTGIDFAATQTYGGDMDGVPYIKSVDDGVITVGLLESLTERTFGPDGEYFGGRVGDRIGTFDNNPPWLACGFMGTAQVFCQPGALPSSESALIHVASSGLTTRLDTGIEQGEAIVCALISNDEASILVISAGSPQTWAEVGADGVVMRSGVAGPDVVPEGYYSRGSRSHSAGCYDQAAGQIAFAFGASGGTVEVFEIDGAVLREVASSLALSYFNFTFPSIYLTGGVVYAFSKNHYNAFSQGLTASSPVLLSDIVEPEALAAKGLLSADLDVTALTSEVRGYRVSQTGAIRAAVDPLQSAWPFDVIQSGYQIKAVTRGGSSVATIPAEMLDARAAGEAPGPQLTVMREMDTQLPRRVSIKHMDVSREYDQGEQAAERLSTESISVREMEMPLVLTAGEAAAKAEVLLYLYWLERHTVQFKLPPEYAGLEPADVITVTAPSASYELRLTSINYLSDGRLECSARYNSAATYTPAALGEEGAVTGGAIGLSGPSRYELLDIPAVIPELDAPAFVAAMTGYTAGWPGGILFRSADSGQTWNDTQGWAGKGTMGTARNALAVAPSSVIDAASVLQVDLISGELESVTELAMLNGANHFAYGMDGRWEIIAARTATLQADGSVVLQDMLRGRFGTEHNTSNHEVGDVLVLLNDTDNALISVDSASIGLSRLYRGITAGRAIDSDSNREFMYRAVNLECLSPVYLSGDRDPAPGDWTLTWVRRTRVGGEWRDSIDAPLSEASEAYEVDIYDNGSYLNVLRTISSSAATVEYTSAQQGADFGATQNTVYVKVYQLSATVGRGFPLTGSISIPGSSGSTLTGDVVLLLHMDGTDGGTTFTDSSPEANTVTANGDAQTSTTHFLAGGSSAKFDGSGDYLTVGNAAWMNFGNDPWTIEFFAYRNGTQGAGSGMVSRRTSAVFCPIEIRSGAGGALEIYMSSLDGLSWAVSSSFTDIVMPDGDWCHVAFCGTGAGGVINAFTDGVKAIGEPTYSGVASGAQDLFIGLGGDGAWNGWIEDLRIITGQALYSADFTPPTAPFDNP